jgi:hypothetical protein
MVGFAIDEDDLALAHQFVGVSGGCGDLRARFVRMDESDRRTDRYGTKGEHRNLKSLHVK